MIGADDEVKGYEKKPFGVQDGEVVTCKILEIDYTLDHKKEIDAINAETKERAEALGDDFTPLPYSFKAGGMSIKYAIMLRGDEKTIKYEYDASIDGLKVTLPNYPVSGLVQHKGFSALMRNLKDLFVTNPDKVYSLQRKGYGSNLKGDKPQIIDLHPDVVPNPKYPEKEPDRKTRWADIAKLWNSLTEEQAKQECANGISRRLGLFTYDGPAIKFHDPAIGMEFKAVIKRNGKYFDIITFKWSSDLRTYECFSDGNLLLSTPLEVQVAKAINEEMIMAKEAWKIKANTKVEVVKEEDPEDSPW